MNGCLSYLDGKSEISQYHSEIRYHLQDTTDRSLKNLYYCLSQAYGTSGEIDRDPNRYRRHKDSMKLKDFVIDERR